MAVYIALLRGVNVGGSKVILMADLKKVFENAAFAKVKTYIQSGNVVFVSEKKNVNEIENTIKEATKSRFKFDIEVIVLSLSGLEKIVAKNPFNEKKLEKGERIYFTMLLKKPWSENIAEFYKTKKDVTKKSVGDDFEIIDRAVYTLCRHGWSNSPFNSNAVVKYLKVDTTARNLETMKKLVEMGKTIDEI